MSQLAIYFSVRAMKTQLYCFNVGPPVIQQPKHDNKKPVRKGSQLRVTLHCTASGYGSLTYH